MKHLSATFKFVLLVFVSVCLQACLPQTTTERAAVVIFNDTTEVIQYQFMLSNTQTPWANIQKNEFDYAYEYEQDGKIDVLPKELSQVTIMVGGCKVMLSRSEMENSFIIDPEGRNTWNLHVTQKLKDKVRCH